MDICQPELALLPYKSQKPKMKINFRYIVQAFNTGSNISDSEIQKCYYSCLNWINTIREEDI